MSYDEFNAFCRNLPATTYVMQWGDSHVWKVGGKVFAIGGWSETKQPAFTFKTTDFDFEVLKDEAGLRPAPYLASRGMKWIQQYEQPGLNDDDLKEYITTSHHLVSLGLSKKLQKELNLNQKN